MLSPQPLTSTDIKTHSTSLIPSFFHPLSNPNHASHPSLRPLQSSLAPSVPRSSSSSCSSRRSGSDLHRCRPRVQEGASTHRLGELLFLLLLLHFACEIDLMSSFFVSSSPSDPLPPSGGSTPRDATTLPPGAPLTPSPYPLPPRQPSSNPNLPSPQFKPSPLSRRTATRKEGGSVDVGGGRGRRRKRRGGRPSRRSLRRGGRSTRRSSRTLLRRRRRR